MSRLPVPGSDQGNWGSLLNDYLSQSHASDGSLKPGVVTEANLSIGVSSKLNAPASISDGSVSTAKLADGTIVDSKISSSAAIAQSKIANLTSDLDAKAPATAIYLPSATGSDQTSAIQAVISSMTAGQVLVIGDRYRVDGTLVFATPNTSVRGSGQGELYSGLTGTTAQVMIRITADNVKLQGFAVTGPQIAAGANQTGISIEGGSAATALNGVILNNMTVSRFGKNGILASYVTNFAFDDNTIFDCCYTGIGILCGINGTIDRNRVRNITQTGYANSYGIYTSRYESTDLSTYPRSANISISGNRVSDIPGWDGINTHGGINHIIANNVITNCSKPIEIVGSDDSSNVTTFAPLDIQIIGNVITSTRTDGTYPGGIVFVGAQGAGILGTPAEYGTGTIIGNVIRGHGKENTSTNGAIHCYYTRGLILSNNTIIEAGANGIYMYHTNTDFTATGNTIVDPWTNSLGLACAISCGSDYNVGYIGGNNRVVRASKTATVVASRGIYIASTANNVITLGDNDMNAATSPVYDTGGKIRAVGSVLRHGVASDRPVASSALLGATYLATDVEGGTTYRCIQTAGTTYAWVKIAAGVTAVASASVDGLWRPRDNNFIGASGDPATCLIANQTAMVSGTQYVSKVRIDQSGPITSVMIYVGIGGTSITEASIDIWDSSGTRIGTADASSFLGSAGLKTMTLTTPTGARTAGEDVYVGIRLTYTGTGPQVRGLSTASIPNANTPTGAKVRFGTAGTGITSPQSTITPASIVSVNVGQQCHWFGLV